MGVELSLLLRTVLEIGALIVVMTMLVQDWRYRGIQWPFFPLLTILLITSRLTTTPFQETLIDTGINVLILGLQVILLTAYVKWRFDTSLFEQLGLGDILYWLASATYFPPLSFLVYHLASLVGALSVYLLLRRLWPLTQSARIPLAGFQAASLGLLLVLYWAIPALRPTNDQALLAYFI